MFFQIMNKGTVSRKYYELIGASNKRERLNDPSVIGNKGSGAKLAVIPLLRLGLELAVSSSDSQGDFVLCYETIVADLGDREVQQIIFRYMGNGSFPSQLTLDAFRDWDQPIGDDPMKIFKALREYIANAWDEDKNFTICEVNEITQAEPGTTAVFITATDEIREILRNFPRYFKFLSDEKPLFTNYYGGIYSKSEPGVTRLFSQGVLVDCKRQEYYSSAFDYSLDEKYLLSEERIIKDFTQYVSGIGNMLSSIEDPSIIIELFRAMVTREAGLELLAIHDIKHVPLSMIEVWRMAWMLNFGKRAVIAVNNTQVDEDARNKGFTVVPNLPYELTMLLKRCGITTASDVAPQVHPEQKEKPDFELVELTAEQKDRFDEAYGMFLRYFPEARKFPVFFFRALDWRWRDTLGHCGVEDKQYREIWIAEPALESMKMILTVLIHEGRHCLTEAGDYDRKFTQTADYQLVALVLANPTPPIRNEWKAQVIQGRGVLIPKRFAGQTAHVLVEGQELRIKFANSVLTALLPEVIEGQSSQRRRVTTFRKLGCVSLPQQILKQLPLELNVEIR